MPELLGDDNKTIFTSCELDSAEREAVQKGEARGKTMAMLERPEHYGNIGSRDKVQYTKNLALICGDCVKCECEHYDPDNLDVVGGHCKLPKNVNCI